MRLSATSLLTATALLSGAFAVGPDEAGAQGALILDVRGGVAAPAGSFKRGPAREGTIKAGPTFGLLFDLRRNDHLDFYVGFSQVLFDCSSDGCVGDEEFVSTSWDLGVHLRARSTTWGPWIRGGVVFARMERDVTAPEGPRNLQLLRYPCRRPHQTRIIVDSNKRHEYVHISIFQADKL